MGMSSGAGKKLGCEKPMGLPNVPELRKSNISLSSGPPMPFMSEHCSKYVRHPAVMHEPNIADALGRDLRSSHIDLGNGRSRSERAWQGVQSADMARHAREKFSCEAPESLGNLMEALRKSSVPLGGQRTQ